MGAASLGILLAHEALFAGVAASERKLKVYKSASCGCCKVWVEHVAAAGFEVDATDVDDVGVFKKKLGVPAALESCHTAVVGGYVIEGHVPADLIDRLLRERPKGAKGLAVAGMPVGSPGMEMGNRKDPYDVVLFDSAGKHRVFAHR